ncbi:ABC-2 transporter permease [Dactylosporangium darangshiense]
MAVLDLRTVWPYRYYCLAVFGLGALVFANKPIWFVPGLVLLFTSQVAPYPFNVSDKAGLETLYAVLPLSRRSVLYGRYAWATACFAATATVGTVLALLLARIQALPFGGRSLATMLTVSWALFAGNIAIQFPLLVRFGYTRVSVLGTVLPLAVVVGTVYKLHLDLASMRHWLPLLWVAGVAAIVASVAVATAADRRRMRYGRRNATT